MAVRNFQCRYKIYTKKEIDDIIDGIGTSIEDKQDKLTAGSNIAISDENVISATDTKYTAGDNVAISDENVISATDTKYTAGTGISISDENVISATGSGDIVWTKYTGSVNDLISSSKFIKNVRIDFRYASISTQGYIRKGDIAYNEFIHTKLNGDSIEGVFFWSGGTDGNMAYRRHYFDGVTPDENVTLSRGNNVTSSTYVIYVSD